LSKVERRSGALTYPGLRLAVLEEFLPGLGTYDEDNEVYASRVGRTGYDLKDHVVEVHAFKHVLTELIKKGRSYVGVVDDVKRNFAHAVLFTGKEDGFFPFEALIHISNSGMREADTMTEVVKPGDVIRAGVQTEWQPVQATLDGDDLGVIRANCSICGGRMEPAGSGVLKCTSCGHLELRKLSKDYGVRLLRSILMPQGWWKGRAVPARAFQ